MRHSERYDLILVGSSFASAFFLHRYLALAGTARRRVLVLERGQAHPHKWYVENDARFVRESESTLDSVYRKPAPQAPVLEPHVWAVRLAYGGASNSWWACTPRLLPEDFEERSRFGVSRDWPLSYADLEPSYCDAEELMSVSGPAQTPYPRSRPYPQPPHRMTDPGRLLREAHGPIVFPQPTARARLSVPSGRPACCAVGMCNQCPTDSKFTIMNGLSSVFADRRVTLLTEATAQAVEVEGSRARAVIYERGGRQHTARADFVGLGANAIFNPYLLLRSGLDDPATGRGLNEQFGMFANVWLRGLDNFQGSTAITGHGYNFYAGEHRKHQAACLVEIWNKPVLRNERGKYRHIMQIKLAFADEREDHNRVVVSPDDPGRPRAYYSGPSRRTIAGIRRAQAMVEQFVAPLPLEARPKLFPMPTESHILGTAPMGADPATSVVDETLVHHRVRNLAVLGGSAFPTSPPANPTLTISALSLYSAQRLFGGASS